MLAAHRSGIRTVILPEKNRKDLVEVPDEVQKDMEFVFCSRMEEVLFRVLGEDNLKAKRAELETVKAAEAAARDKKPGESPQA